MYTWVIFTFLAIVNKAVMNVGVRAPFFNSWVYFFFFRSLCHVQLSVTPWSACSMPDFPVLHHLREFAHTHVHWVGDAIQQSHPLCLPSPLPSCFLNIRVFFQWVGFFHQVAKVLEFHFSISPSSEYSGLISLRIDWLDLLAVQETPKSLLQHHSSKASILWCSLLYGPGLTSICDHWKNHRFDLLCRQSSVSAF